VIDIGTGIKRNGGMGWSREKVTIKKLYTPVEGTLCLTVDKLHDRLHHTPRMTTWCTFTRHPRTSSLFVHVGRRAGGSCTTGTSTWSSCRIRHTSRRTKIAPFIEA